MLLLMWLFAGAGAAAADPLPADATEFLPQVAARDWNSIVLHHSATHAGDVASIDRVHRRQRDASGRPWLGIGYHFVIGNGQQMADGEVQPTFRWQQQLAGAHAGRGQYNERGIGICLIGNFEQMEPTARQVAAARALVRTLATRHAISRDHVVRHQDVHATACPGRYFPWDQVVSEVAPSAPRASSTTETLPAAPKPGKS